MSPRFRRALAGAAIVWLLCGNLPLARAQRAAPAARLPYRVPEGFDSAQAIVATFPGAQRPIPVISEMEQAGEAAILRALDMPFTARFDKKPLPEVLAAVSRTGGFSVNVDGHALENAGINSVVPLSGSFDQASLRSALDLMLRPVDLAWVVKDETLLITTREHADAVMRTVVYPVADLVGRHQDFGSLIDLITTTLAPTTWDEVGGPGSIAEFRTGLSVVISQTAEVHEQVTNLLFALRKARAVQGLAPMQATPPGSAAPGAVRATADESSRYVIPSSSAWQLPRTHQ